MPESISVTSSKQDRAAVGQFESPGPRSISAGEGAAFVSE